MGMLKFDLPHTLSKDEAKKRTEALLRYWQTKHGLSTHWNGDGATMSGRIMGVTLQASITVSDTAVGGEATDPGMLFRDKARKYLTQKFSAFLDPNADLARLERGD